MCEHCKKGVYDSSINIEAAPARPITKSVFKTQAPKSPAKTVAPRPVTKTPMRPVTKTRFTTKPTTQKAPARPVGPAPARPSPAPVKPTTRRPAKPTRTPTRQPARPTTRTQFPATPSRPIGPAPSRPGPARPKPVPKGTGGKGKGRKGKPFPENQREHTTEFLQDLYENGYDKVNWNLSPSACGDCHDAKNKWDNSKLKDFIEQTHHDAPIWSKSHPRCQCTIALTGPDKKENPMVKTDWRGVEL